MQCNYCSKTYVGGATRILDHLCNTCTGESEEFISSRLRRQERLLAQCDTFEVKKAKRSDSDDDATDEEDLTM